MPKIQWLLIGIVVAHAIVTVLHGLAHERIQVFATPEQNLFIGSVIVLAPLVGAILVASRYRLVGAWVLLFAMIGSAVFGIVNHTILPGPDNVSEAPASGWGSLFVWSAWALTVVESIGAVTAVLTIREMKTILRARGTAATSLHSTA
jgi:hypothetical protein